MTEPRPTLERGEQKGRFKLYQSDVGMLMSRYRSSVALAVLAGERSVNFGSVYENAVAQELAAGGVPLHYYYHSRKGEVDFVVETDDGVVPIEVKSGKGYKRHVALDNLLSSDEWDIGRAYVLSEANVLQERREGGIVCYLPLYMRCPSGSDGEDLLADLVDWGVVNANVTLTPPRGRHRSGGPRGTRIRLRPG